MRLVAQIHVTVSSERVRRDPTLMERLRRRLGGTVDLETAEVQNQLEATAIVDGVRRALGRLGVTNALSLVVDDTVIFQDADSRPGDLPDLVLALAEHVSLFGRGFRELRFAAEHEEAGLHLVIETRARTRHRRDEPAAVVSVGGRIRELEARSGESAEAYRARVGPRLDDASSFATAKASFESFAARLRDALQAAMPEAAVEERRAEARLVKAPERGEAAPAAPERAPREPMHPAYDPFLVYYPSPLSTMLDAMMFASFMHMMMPPPVMVVSPLGMPLGSMDEIRAQPELLAAADPSDVDTSVSAPDSDGERAGDDADGGAVDGGDETGRDDDSAWDGDDGGGGWNDGGGGWDDGGGGGGDDLS